MKLEKVSCIINMNLLQLPTVIIIAILIIIIIVGLITSQRSHNNRFNDKIPPSTDYTYRNECYT